jgi:ATP phosphoribosyltransferase regulatory subunit
MSARRDRWLLPEGVDEALPEAAARIERLRRRVLDLCAAWGYELVIPPLIEHLESLLTGTGHDLERQTFKLLDPLTGRLLGVRADMTPQVARMDAHGLKREGVSRLCYFGTVLHASPDSQDASRSPMQVGAELYGHAGTEADVEVMGLMLEVLAAAGLRDIVLDLGHVGVFRRLAARAGLETAQEDALSGILRRKALPELATFCAAQRVPADCTSAFTALCEMNGDAALLDSIGRDLPCANAVSSELAELRRAAADIQSRAPGMRLHVDLAELRGYRYHTGLLYTAYATGQGKAVAQGGRYDGVGAAFGRARPAAGFSADLKSLAVLTPLPEATDAGGIAAPWENDAGLQVEIAALRAAGERVVQHLPGAAPPPGCSRRLMRSDGGGWCLQSIV